MSTKSDEIFSSLIYVGPCIIYENDERYQLDATLLFVIITLTNNYTTQRTI